MKRTPGWVFASLLVPGLALAQEPAPIGPQQPADIGDPILPNLLSTRTGTTLDLGFDYIDLDGVSDVYLFAVRLHGQFLTEQGMGGYVLAPLAILSSDADDDTQLGNVEVGGLYRTQQPSGMAVMLRGGVSIDTQDEPSLDELDSAFLNLFAHSIPRPTDAFTIAGINTTWGRAQVQVTQRQNNIVFGGMLGADVPIAGDVADADDLTALVNGAAAVGYQDPKFGGAIGLTFVQSVSDGDDEMIKNVFLHGNMAINPSARIYGGFGLPLDGEDLVDGTAFMFGVRAGM